METDQPNRHGPPGPEDDKAGSETHEHKNHLVTVSVNEHPVKLLGRTATGAEIKTAAIEQGVNIQLNFMLEEQLSDGTCRVVHDQEHVQLREELRFIAREPENHIIVV